MNLYQYCPENTGKGFVEPLFSLRNNQDILQIIRQRIQANQATRNADFTLGQSYEILWNHTYAVLKCRSFFPV